MKKIILILLCVPLIGFGQLEDYYKSKSHPKAKGLNFQIKTPSGFEQKEADRPNIVQKWTKGTATFMVLVKNLDQENLNLQELKDLFFFLPSPFAMYGDYERFEKIHKYLKKRIDILLNRKAGIHKESAYLTAIGHMCHFVYLLKAIEYRIY